MTFIDGPGHYIFELMAFHPIIMLLNPGHLWAALVLSLALAAISYRLRALSISGAIGMVIAGTVMLGLGGVPFAIPLLFFYFTSSILTFLKSPAKLVSLKAMDKTGPRDIWQVLSNGGVATVAAALYFTTGNVIWFFAGLASLCEACSDTWATEIGTLAPGRPVSVVSLKRIEPGQSGGMSILGTLATIAGALLTMLVTRLTAGTQGGAIPVSVGIWFASANCGLAGSLLDSLLGASIQAQYRCDVCDRITELRIHCGRPSHLERGLRLINNDVVNLASTLFAALIITALLVFRV